MIAKSVAKNKNTIKARICARRIAFMRPKYSKQLSSLAIFFKAHSKIETLKLRNFKAAQLLNRLGAYPDFG